MYKAWKLPLYPSTSKDKQTEKSTLLRSIREMRSQGKLLPLKLERSAGEYGESQLNVVEVHIATSVRTRARVGKPVL